MKKLLVIALCFALMACATGPKTATLSKIVTYENAEGLIMIEKHYDISQEQSAFDKMLGVGLEAGKRAGGL